MSRRCLAPLITFVLLAAACVDEPAIDDDDDATEPTIDDDDSAGSDCADDYDWGQGGEWMLPGSECLSCHSPGGHAETAFSAGGTVFVSPTCPEPVAGAVIHIWDADRRWFSLPTNEAGNFWTTEPISLPVRIALEVDGQLTWKPGLQPFLDCNSCHALDRPGPLLSAQ